MDRRRPFAHAVLTARGASRKEGRDCATRHLHAALVICREIGAVLLQNDIIGLMRTAGIRQLGNANHKLPGPPHPDVPVLTIRELDVLRLVVRGSSNGQIAIQLGISSKTASVHVSNILRKLDATNRVQAAVRAARLGLVPSVERA